MRTVDAFIHLSTALKSAGIKTMPTLSLGVDDYLRLVHRLNDDVGEGVVDASVKGSMIAGIPIQISR